MFLFASFKRIFHNFSKIDPSFSKRTEAILILSVHIILLGTFSKCLSLRFIVLAFIVCARRSENLTSVKAER